MAEAEAESVVPGPTVAEQAKVERSFDITTNINYLLRRAHAHADHLFNEAMSDLGLTPRQAALLYAVERCEGGSISALTRLTGMDRGTLSEMTPRLVNRGLILRIRDVKDGRAKSLFLSEEGAALVRKVTERTQDLRAKVLEPLPVEYHDLFIKMLSLLVGLEVESRMRTTMASYPDELPRETEENQE